ncbi:inositol monophosphatase family protein [Agilicoccus flavus]|uniref:inositol monophosphatase family protein n=1 Tax=Agilicoccus flavus TaxID=2775968 RepID=UPI001CF62516|nr:inositol monophosphatase family protein [Agilicoccus flavus]
MSAASAGDLAALEALAADLARSAGRLVVDERPERLATSTKSSDSDVVTEMDARAEAYLVARLAAERPGDGVLGEERGTTSGDGPITWVLDPIDGTVNYLYGSPEFAVSVAAVVGDPSRDGAWEPVAGAVAQPSTGVVFHASRGGGAWREGPDGRRALHVGRTDRLDLTLLGTGFGYQAQRRREQAQVLLELLPVVRDIRRGGSAALDLCAVADGRLDAYYERGVNAWDIAAGWLVVTEAGGRLAGVGSHRPNADGVIAAGPAVFNDLVALVDRAVGRP